jgi:lysozyme family protein
MNFKDFPRNVLAYEGGWVDHPKEPRWGNNERGYASHFGTPKSKIALHNISDD